MSRAVAGAIIGGSMGDSPSVKRGLAVNPTLFGVRDPVGLDASASPSRPVAEFQSSRGLSSDAGELWRGSDCNLSPRLRRELGKRDAREPVDLVPMALAAAAHTQASAVLASAGAGSDGTQAKGGTSRPSSRPSSPKASRSISAIGPISSPREYAVVVDLGDVHLGIRFEGLPPERVVVAAVEPLSWGCLHGVRLGDELVCMDGRSTKNVDAQGFQLLLRRIRPLRLRF
eukprot:CAMPEP_0176086528 /NCGR_PEP_ID=MMETSP0120_2-20121206/43313_1 /TAXON_ID=160619 /ORGANISM="Kryptoperidinium foliaceum, Strain CCMP 1326" /LENGTH=228 /DNA_ID=CAMNT_0017420359 /DNA_START=66 /DNA_END=749 /DNA_ORIENTATION=-